MTPQGEKGMAAFGALQPVADDAAYGRICPISDLRADGFERLSKVEIRRSFQRYDWPRGAISGTVPARDIASLHGLNRRTDMRKGPR
jgi:hypothetical protein